MGFGQKMLEKYGWKEGEGLGKQSDGIKEAIKPKRKSNTLGLGFKLGAEFQDNWWEKVYNEAASNTTTSNKKRAILLNTGQEDDHIEYLPHKKKRSKKYIKDEYSIFKKKEDNDSSNVNDVEDVDCDGAKEIDIFQKCKGRTVHKGARHGLNLSGKLSRLEEQEREYLHSIEGAGFKKTKRKKKYQ